MRCIIVEHTARGLANCMWNDLSIYAYAFERGASVWNLTSLEHTRWRPLHWIVARLIDLVTRKTCEYWAGSSPKLLPPSAPLPDKFRTLSTVYFFGWLFRNPVGMERHRTELLRTFAPSQDTEQKIANILAPHAGKILIGIRLREKPFKGFEKGEFLVSPERARHIANEYVRTQGIKSEQAVCIEVSDRGPYDERTALTLLSRCNVVIGDNSTYSSLAAWMGNVPHIVTTNDPIDWAYYREKTKYFENKYATFAHGSLLYP